MLRTLLALSLFAICSTGCLSIDPLDTMDLPLATPRSCNCIAFRLDDVQDYFVRSAQIDLISMFIEEEVSLTIGAIGGFLKDDEDFIQFLNDSVKTGLIEVANHGWTHIEHSKMSLDDQRNSILETNKNIQQLLGVEAKTFIPPENSFNEDTLSIMREAGLTHLSGSIFTRADEPPYPLKNGDMIFHFPQTAYVSNVDTPSGIWTIFPNDVVLKMIRSSLKNYGFAVVVMHPVAHYDVQDGNYIYNKETLDSVKELLRTVKNEFKIVKISNIDKQGWIPFSDHMDETIFAYFVPIRGDYAIGASVSDLTLNVQDDEILLGTSNNAWEKPLLLLFPSSLILGQPNLTFGNIPIPKMQWFESNTGIWVIYLDPPQDSIYLRVSIAPDDTQEFDIIFLGITVIIVTLFLLLIFRKKIQRQWVRNTNLF